MQIRSHRRRMQTHWADEKHKRSTVQALFREYGLDRAIVSSLTYIDDFFIAADIKEECEKALGLIQQWLERLEWKVKSAKTMLPTTALEFTGIGINTQRLAVYILLRKKEKALRKIEALLRSDNSTTVQVLNKRHSTAGGLGQLLEEVQALERKVGIEVAAVHIPGCENSTADALSRLPGKVHKGCVLTEKVRKHFAHQQQRCKGEA
uniref:Reverse transcriptase domain-containing protein n=1 Tax=Chromera velia CCMP2878 TaxID=1169474 RepID=A0A0G4HID2_9ALVE|eukprot:Cvel_27813.t1-p1 / transcript=Cvel_27813.t1 / gene=Cvel_27813 / organism=Chromera_velia_CCMP2878 / gene_product=hypothetical protein / transcript_product=hypothetical protein / location=Cvel_scaffold3532:5494-7344(-) / protein_length=206 / sequence_SO=supercontig / SO=protein_coding / is_pseudo=false